VDLNSVERIAEWLELPQEPAGIIEGTRPPAYWPSSSNSENFVVVEDLVLKYAPELEPVLHGVSFTLRAKERIGLIGRTGSGKSTLAMAFLRFVDPEEGRILIDGIDICKIGLQDLRSKLVGDSKRREPRSNIDYILFADYNPARCCALFRDDTVSILFLLLPHHTKLPLGKIWIHSMITMTRHVSKLCNAFIFPQEPQTWGRPQENHRTTQIQR